MQKPSARIREITGGLYDHWAYLDAIVRYLDEQYEAEHSSTAEERSRLMNGWHSRECELNCFPLANEAKCTCPKQT